MPAQDSPDSLDDELSVSVQSHDGHFLERTLRCEGRDLDRAVRLYHHAPVVKERLRELVTAPTPRGRLAIPLREAPPSPHVIVTEGGSFVTCLAEHMSIADLPVLPYERFLSAMDQADHKIERYRVRRQQMKELSGQMLFDALCAGPGHVTREIIEVFDRDPETYMVVIAKLYTWCVKIFSDNTVAICRANHSPRRIEVVREKMIASAKLCAYLMAFIHTPYMMNVLLPFVPLETDLEVTLGIAVARHPQGGQRLLDLAEKGKGVTKSLAMIGAYVMNCCMLQPTEAEALCRRYRAMPLRYQGWEKSRVVTEIFLSRDGVDLTQLLTGVRDYPHPQVVPESPTWIFSSVELMRDAFWHRKASQFFPPAVQAEAVRAAWAKHLHSVEEWRGYKAYNAVPVRKEARIGRNDPCPCDSGKKHKQCCLGKPTGPTAEEKEAAELAAREAFVVRELARAQKAAAAARPQQTETGQQPPA